MFQTKKRNPAIRIAAILLAVLLLAGAAALLPGLRGETHASTYGVYTYTVANGEVTITDCDNSASGKLVIPDYIGDYPVTAIGKMAFYYCDKITEVVLPDTLDVIGVEAFNCCYALTSVEIPFGVDEIGDSAFRNCESLESIEIFSTVEVIGRDAFRCSGLKTVVLWDGVEYISNSMFADCDNLTEIYIPSSVTKIDDWAFYACDNLETVTFNEGLEEIGSEAFSYCPKLTGVSLPVSLTSIGSDGFYGCESLTSIVIPYKVKTVGGYAFSGCSGLEKIRCLANSKPAGWSDDWDYGISAEVFWGLDKPRMWLTSLGNGIRLNWDAVSYATKYNVWRKAPGGSWENIGSSRSLTYTDKTAEAGTEYYYRIRAQVSKVYSPYSTTLSMLWLERPEAPKPVNAVSGVKLTWAEVKGADRYDIWRSEDGGGFIKIGHSHKASYIDKQAESGVVYQYKLKAVCQDTIYTSSSEESAKIVRLAAPETTIKAYASGIKLTWKTVPGATLYNIWRKAPGGSYEKIGTSRTLAYVDRTVTGGKTYSYYVVAQYSKYLSSHNTAVSATAK